MEYPKINSLYKREGCGPYDEGKKRYVCDLEGNPRKSKLIIGEYSCPEFEAIDTWTITEKIDGTNVRIIYDRKENKVKIAGRTDNAQFPLYLLEPLQSMFPLEKMSENFKDSNFVILFGEGYGPKIQCGEYYRKDCSFILFDAFISGWWLTRDSIQEIANQLGIDHVPTIQNPYSNDNIWNKKEIENLITSLPRSGLAKDDHIMEGIIARSEPQMMFRKGGPIMFKLKCKDYDERS